MSAMSVPTNIVMTTHAAEKTSVRTSTAPEHGVGEDVRVVLEPDPFGRGAEDLGAAELLERGDDELDRAASR